MKFYILKAKIGGIKNINKPIELNFYKNNISNKKFDIEKYHVKAIYGTNGAGKTAIMKAIDVYKNIMIQSDYITLENTQPNLINLLNQVEKHFIITITYAVLENNELQGIYSSYLSLKEDNNKIQINEESLSKLKGSNLTNSENYEILYHVINGEIIKFSKKYDDKTIDFIKDKTSNLLNKQTFISTVTNILLNSKNDIEVDSLFTNHIFLQAVFVRSINVVLQDTDENYININTLTEIFKILKNLQDKINLDDELLGKMLSGNRLTKDCIENVNKAYYNNYVKWVNNLKVFIKVFKNDLDDIEIKKVDNGEFYECELILKYKNGTKINRKYESTGIKKIINLYSALSNLNNGQIVFIDEFDANIHDVLLNKIIEYVLKYAKGQLIFTTHNVELMDTLKTSNLSIDFLSPCSEIVSWTKNGNYSPSRLYKKGLINLSPFNIEAFDFLGVFGDEDNE